VANRPAHHPPDRIRGRSPGVISAFRLFDTVYLMTGGGPYHASDVLVTYLYVVAFNGNDVGYGSAIGVVLFIIIFVFAIVQLRLTRGRIESLI
jgi:ABC-type sugar transport system permease subunit